MTFELCPCRITTLRTATLQYLRTQLEAIEHALAEGDFELEYAALDESQRALDALDALEAGVEPTTSGVKTSDVSEHTVAVPEVAESASVPTAEKN